MKKNNKFLTIIGASEHNLKNISLRIPIGSITCVNGISGSGKSTLVNSVIAKEAFRQEKLAQKNKDDYYKLVRPDFESVKDLPNVLIVNQKPLLHLEKSTVATASGLGDLLRGAFLREGIIECQCGSIVDNKVSYETLEKVIKLHTENDNLKIFVDYVGGTTLNKNHFSNYMREHGFHHFQIDGKKKQYSINNINSLKEGARYKIQCVALSLNDLAQKKIPTDRISIYVKDELILDFTYQTFCPLCLKEHQKKSLSLFTTSRLSDKSGCCKICSGLGKTQVINSDHLLIRSNSLDSHFLNIPFENGQYKSLGIYKSSFSKIIKKYGFKSSTPYEDLSDDTQKELNDLIKRKLINRCGKIGLEDLLIESECLSCCGTGFNYKARAVKIDGRNISEILSLTIEDAVPVLKNLKLNNILEALADLSLGHLALRRSTDTLSGGELQRVKLVQAISSGLTNSLIIIDEPSSGLSFSDVDKLFHLLTRLRDEGNTVLIVDHSEHIINKSDYSLYLGPGSGPSGGDIIERVNQIVTEDELSTESVDNEAWENKYLILFPVTHNNVLNQRVVIPLGAITAVVGDSGSGKSSLIQGVIECISNSASERKNSDLISKIVLLNQKPIRASKRSSVLTFLGLSDELRKIFSQSSPAKLFALDSSYFTSNSLNGACSHCEGDGEIDGSVCYSCGGARFKSIVLSVTVNDLNILDILDKPAFEVMDLELPPIIQKGCRILAELGLGHLGLGRVLTDVSGGEAQRLKLAKFLIENEKTIASVSQHLMIILDEPCRGLSTKDSKFILGVFKQLAQTNNTVVVIEHNPYVISQTDYVIQLGPGVGALGGKIIFSGPTEKFKTETCLAANDSPKSILGISSLACCLSEEDKHFALIKDYSLNHEIVSNRQIKFFPSKIDLISFAEKNAEDGLYYFNPFCNDFFLSKTVPNSLIKKRFSELLKFGLEHAYIAGNLISLQTAHKSINQTNIWYAYVPSDDSALAYSLGGGWLSLKQKDGSFLNIATRLVDIEGRVVGTRSITAKTFNTFYNGCDICLGTGNLFFYDDFIGDPTKSVIDVEFYKKELQKYFKKHLSFKIKESVALFKSEGLLDLSKPFDSLGSNEKLIAFFGLPNFSFIKKNGRQDALSDRIDWIGLISIFNQHAKKIDRDIGFKLGTERQLIECPECNGSKFKKEVSYYLINGKAIYEQVMN
ncbi:ATP-binding cassette domain-containing protein [Vibrio sp. MEBiC08052]|uniref:ATP-binding cassette domain-containing protein n=1 Tax=Vibrio sp. MEBiC08052 TaxID=1761910 RepID=UPI0007406311|nr:ATP-binding cassette domain-containing protein [Vibrio sp. MEBiC08052]KUI99468.1 hypothetical protein VRK_15520 [Vibrio sp. MEBiC08052]